MMNSQSLFDTASGFSLQMEDFLENPYGLSSDILPADDGLGGLFGLEAEDPFRDLKSSGSFPQPPDVLDELLQESAGDPLSEEWMEIGDFNFLIDDPSVESIPQGQPKPQQKPQALQQKSAGVKVKIVMPEAPAVVKKEPHAVTKTLPQEQESAFELLKSLLTGAVSFRQSPTVSVQPTPPESPEPQVAPQIPSPLSSISSTQGSPDSSIAEVLDMQQEIPIPSPVFEVVEVEPQITLQPVIESDNSALLEVENYDLQSPLSNLSSDDIESILLSGPSSPSDFLQTIDQSQIASSSYSVSFIDKNGKSKKHSGQNSYVSTVSIADFDDSSRDDVSDPTYTPKGVKFVRTKKSRPAPYEVDSDYLPQIDTSHLSRKDKKRVQNKNAATRYRQKKREMKTQLVSEEDLLLKKNTELRDKVDSLEREIKYMKDLMEEIYKVKASQK